MTDGVMVAQRFLAPFVGVRVPIGQPKKRLERGVFLYSDMGREPNGFDHNSCEANFLWEALRRKDPKGEPSTTVRASSIRISSAPYTRVCVFFLFLHNYLFGNT